MPYVVNTMTSYEPTVSPILQPLLIHCHDCTRELRGKRIPEGERDVDTAQDCGERGGAPGRDGELDLGDHRAVDPGGEGVRRGECRGAELEPTRDGAGADRAKLHPQLHRVSRQPRPERGQQPRARRVGETHPGMV